MPQLFLHIGTEKTGSTAIQRMLGGHQKALSAQGVHYPDIEEGLLRNMLGQAFSSTPPRKRAAGSSARHDSQAQQRALEAFAQTILQLPSTVGSVIIVGELLSRQIATQESIERFQAFLTPLFSKLNIIIYLRRQDTHFASAYTQSLRTGNLSPPDIDRDSEAYGLYDYDALLTRWASIFGRDAMLPRVYERGPDRAFDVLEDFARTCHFSLPAKVSDGVRVRNPSISVAGQQVLLELGRKLQARSGREHVGGASWRRLAASVTAASPGAGWQPTRTQAQDLVARYAVSNEAVRKSWFPERASLFNDDFSTSPEHQAEPDREHVKNILADVVASILTEGIEREQHLLVEKALLARELGDDAKCRSLLTEAVHADRFNAFARAHLAKIQIASGEMEEARINIDAASHGRPLASGRRQKRLVK
jgi:hypothetical protein